MPWRLFGYIFKLIFIPRIHFLKMKDMKLLKTLIWQTQRSSRFTFTFCRFYYVLFFLPEDFWPQCHHTDFGFVSKKHSGQAEWMHSELRRELHRSVSWVRQFPTKGEIFRNHPNQMWPENLIPTQTYHKWFSDLKNKFILSHTFFCLTSIRLNRCLLL